MSNRINIVRKLLAESIERIDAGNSNLTEEEEKEVINLLQTISDEKISKYEARHILNDMPASTFDKHVHDGDLPKGRKRAGWKELFWYKRDIIGYKSKMK